MKDKTVNLQADALFQETETLRAALALLGAADRAMVQLKQTGQIAALTDAAKEALLLSARDVIFERLSAVNAAMLRDALERGEPVCFSDDFGGCRMYDISSTPVSGGALLLLDPRRRQTFLEARVHQDVRASVQNILLAAHRLSGKPAGRYDALREQLEADVPADALRAEAARLCDTLRGEDGSQYSQLVRESLRIERALRHAELLQAAPTPDAKPVFIEGDLAELCRQCAESFRQKCEARVEVRAPQAVSAVYDPDWIKSALLNLLTNAVKASHVTITLSRQDTRLMISVEDDGCGVPPEELFHLYHAWQEEFQPAAYLSSGLRPGLGLPLVRMIAEAHGGCLLHEKLERGGIFRLCISSLLMAEPPEIRSALVAASGFSTADIELSVI